MFLEHLFPAMRPLYTLLVLAIFTAINGYLVVFLLANLFELHHLMNQQDEVQDLKKINVFQNK